MRGWLRKRNFILGTVGAPSDARICARIRLLLLWAVGLGLIVLPIVPLFITSGSSLWRWPELWPEAWGLRAWNYVFFGSSGTWRALFSGFVIAAVVTVISFVIAFPAADALARRAVRGKRWIEAVLYAPIIVPGFLVLMGIHSSFIRFGLANTSIGVVLASLPLSLPYMLRPLTVGFATLGMLWEDQGRMLGAGWWSRMRWIVWPALAPSIAIGCGFTMVVAFSQYLIPLIIGGGSARTLPMVMMPFLAGGDPAIGAAYGLLFSVSASSLLWLSGASVRFLAGEASAPSVPRRGNGS